jgi:hypothetical protein
MRLSMVWDYPSTTDKRIMTPEEFERFSKATPMRYMVERRPPPPPPPPPSTLKPPPPPTLEALVDVACEAVRESIRADLIKVIDEFKTRLTSKPAEKEKPAEKQAE